MKEQTKDAPGKSKGFFKSLIEKLDSKLKEKAEHGSCCAPKEKGKESDKTSCCS